MLEYTQNGYGQQNYAVHEETYAYEESWGSENEHHGHGHHDGAQAQLVCYPVKDHGPKLNKHQTMSHGSETKYGPGHGAGWSGPNASYGYSMPTNVHMGAKTSPYGGRYPGKMMMEASEHEVHYKVNGSPHMKSEGMKYHDSGRHGSNGGYRRGYDDGYGCQSSVEWEAKAL